MAKPTAITGADIALTQASVSTNLSQALGTGTGVDSQGGRSIQSYQWVLLSKPAGSSAVITNANTATPTLASVDTWGNYLLFLRVTDTYGSASEANPYRAPSTALQVVRVKSSGLSLEKPASGERGWSASMHKVIDAVESLNTKYASVSTVSRLAGTRASAAQLDRLTDPVELVDMHRHSGGDIAQASMTTRGTVTLAYEPVSVASPKAVNQVCGAWHQHYRHFTGKGPLGAQCTITFTGNPATDLSETITIISADNHAVTYRANLSSDWRRGYNHFRADESVANIANKLKQAIQHASGHGSRFSITEDGAGSITLTQKVPGVEGNTFLYHNLGNTTTLGFDNGGRSNTLQSGGLDEEAAAAFVVADSNVVLTSVGLAAKEARTSSNPITIEFRLLNAAEFKGLKTSAQSTGTALSATGSLLGTTTLQHAAAGDSGKPLSGYTSLGAYPCAQGSVIVARPKVLLEATASYIDLVVTNYAAIPNADTLTLAMQDDSAAHISPSTVNTTWNAQTSNLTTAAAIATWVNTTTKFSATAATLDAATAASATATVTISDYSELGGTDSVALLDTSNVRHTFVQGTDWSATTSNNQTATSLATAIAANAQFSTTVSSNVITITQATKGPAGNTAITLTDSGTAGMAKTDFSGGVDGNATVRVSLKSDYGSAYADATVVMGTGGGITLGTSGSATTSTFSAGGYTGEDYKVNDLNIIANWRKRY